MQALYCYRLFFVLIVAVQGELWNAYLVARSKDPFPGRDILYASLLYNEATGELYKRIDKNQRQYLTLEANGGIHLGWYKPNTTFTFDANHTLLVDGRADVFCAVKKGITEKRLLELQYHPFGPPKGCTPVQLMHDAAAGKDTRVCRYDSAYIGRVPFARAQCAAVPLYQGRPLPKDAKWRY